MGKAVSKSLIPTERIEGVICTMRSQKVILDEDLAILYEVETKSLNRAFYRNEERFPEDFAFQITKSEWNSLKYQFGTSKKGRGGRRKLPIAFTEEGVAMLSGILRSAQAVTVNIEIMRAFVRMRYIMTSQKEMSKELTEVKSFLLKHSNSSDREFRRVWQDIEKLSQPPTQEERRIGFQIN
ncbi:ORF6N domain-containing protein [Patescibacteria group bacterium]|nr:ORF6N domain-containing protein [Patescibacteria group bacterium]MBU1016514.1 ORF6N domain-containing protein [Patescibacteria group bacterium]MBU1685107.1 ORF6N domain-containing protein [Patescibacteria group bacterium]MBU1938607.1 ORF6N domain-containing protein [Patescibacteria group bacterium]